MFGTLLESRARRERAGKGTVVSVVLHAGLIVLATVATARATVAPPAEERIVDLVPPAPPPEPPPERSDEPTYVDRTTVAPRGVFGRRVIETVIDVPIGIPPIDPLGPTVDPRDWTGQGVSGGRHDGDRNGAPLGSGTVESPLTVWQVDKPVLSAGGCAPRFPDVLRSANVEGEVLAQFVVDEDGRVREETFRTLKSTHELFAQSVKSCLHAMRFAPAEARGRKVAQLVQQPFVFALRR